MHVGRLLSLCVSVRYTVFLAMLLFLVSEDYMFKLFGVRSSVTLMGFTKDVRAKRIVCGDNLFAEILRGRQKHDVTIQVRMRTY